MAELKVEISDLPSAVTINDSDLLHIKQGIIDKKITFTNMLLPHTTDYENPHQVTKAQVGLGNVTNDAQLKIASNFGDVDNVQEARLNIDVYSKGESDSNLTAHSGDKDNPHDVTKAQVGLGSVQNYGISNSYTLNNSGSYASSKAVHDALNNINQGIGVTLTSHVNNTNNPHQVTKAQLGLGNVKNYGVSNSYTSSSSTTYASSKAVRDGINSIETAISDSIFSRGMVLLWSGAINTIPSGFALCDGSNGTPDLRDRFVVGAGNSYGLGDVGGTNSNNHSHPATVGNTTLTAGQIPPHNHDASHNHSASFSGNNLSSHSHSASHNHSASFSGNNLGSHSHSASHNHSASFSGSTMAGHTHSANHNHSASFAGNMLPSHNHSIYRDYKGSGSWIESGDSYTLNPNNDGNDARINTKAESAGRPSGTVSVSTKNFNTGSTSAGKPSGSVTVNTKSFNTGSTSAGRPSGSVSVSTRSLTTSSSSAGKPTGSVSVSTKSFNTGYTGGGSPHNHGVSVASKSLDNRPPYYALAYIMKL